jgi:hypothetical protein
MERREGKRSLRQVSGKYQSYRLLVLLQANGRVTTPKHHVLRVYGEGFSELEVFGMISDRLQALGMFLPLSNNSCTHNNTT